MRMALTAQAQEEAARAVLAHLSAFASYRQARCVMAYMACRGELSLAPTIERMLKDGKTLALPRCETPGVMTARRIDRLSQLRPGAYGLMEPEESCAVIAPQEIGLILVPGTAFDRSGDRIGQGGGYYDRFLKETSALRVGVCHDFALLGCVPAQEHDQRMHHILTPGGLIACGREKSDRFDDIQEEQP